MIVLSPKPLAAPLKRAFEIPRDDDEAKAERKLLHQIRLSEQVRK